MADETIASGRVRDIDGVWCIEPSAVTTPSVMLNMPSGITWLTLTELRELRAGLDAAIAHLEGKE